MTPANKWLIVLIDRLRERFVHCGFSYAYEADSEQHVIQLTSSDVLDSDVFRTTAGHAINEFGREFPDEGVLFIDDKNAFPIEPPILYRVQPAVMEQWSNSCWEQKTTRVVYYGMSLELDRTVYRTSQEPSVHILPLVLVGGGDVQAGSHNYAMAA